MEINTSFNIGQKVIVVPLDIRGKITGIFVDKAGYEYQVSYFFNGKTERAYFEEEDIKVISEEVPHGFFSNR